VIRVLALDTASPRPALALLEVSEEGGERSWLRPLPLSAAEAIAPELDALLHEAGLPARDLSRIAVLSGPGSFTGLRAGTAFARGLARALGAPFVAIGTFNAAAAALPEPEGAVFILDAGRGEVHRARRRGGALDVDVSPVPVAVARSEAEKGSTPVVDLAFLPASLALAAARLALTAESGAGETAPAYGRRSAAEEKLERGPA
jgi:tRNA threonylcarbamoyladenosine biosynthesis protein TsaB